MPDDTTQAIQALLKQVQELTERLDEQSKQFDAQQKRLDDLHAFNGKILDEKKDAQRKANFLEEHLDKDQRKRDLAAKGIKELPDGRVVLDSSNLPTHTITREEARDPSKYREAKAAAKAAGAELRIVDPTQAVDPTQRNTSRHRETIDSKTISFDDAHEGVRWVRADHAATDGFIQRRLAAEREGLKVKHFHTLDDLPEHARTKFRMMEKAATDADDDS